MKIPFAPLGLSFRAERGISHWSSWELIRARFLAPLGMTTRKRGDLARVGKEKNTTEATESTEKNNSCFSAAAVISAVSHFFGSQGRFANRPCNDRLYQSSLSATWITLGGSSKPVITPKVPGAKVLLGGPNWAWFQEL